MSEYTLTVSNFNKASHKAPTANVVDREDLKAQAQKFEAVFVAQMLKHSGLAEALTKNGGKEVAAFSDFYVQNLADEIVKQDGFGLAEKFYENLLKKQNQNSLKIDIDNVS